MDVPPPASAAPAPRGSRGAGRRRRWALPLALLAVLLAASGAPAETVAQLGVPTDYVSDFAHVLSPQTIEQTDTLCYQLETRAHAQLFVVTIRSLDGEPIEEFSNDLFHKWGIGDKKTNRGLLLLLVTADHRGRIEVGLGLEGVVTDSIAGRIGRGLRPAMNADRWDAAVLQGSGQLAGVVAADAHVQLDHTQSLPPEAPPGRAPGGGILGWLVLVAILVLLSRVFGGRRGYWGGGYWGGGFGGGGFGGGGDGGGFSGGGGGDSGGGGASF